jgi:MATE family multidrug resistance protein
VEHAHAGALRRPTRADVWDVARLAAPIVVVQVGMMSMGAVDAAMLGRVSPAAMGGGALGNFYWLIATIIGQGAVQAIDPLVSQALGAGDTVGMRRGVQRGLIIGALLAVPASLLLVPAGAILRWLGQPPDVAALAGDYAIACIPGTLAYFWFFALRQSLQALQRPGPLVLTVVAANVFNAFLDWILIFGNWGFPRLEVAGAAWATSIGRWGMCLMLAVLGWRHLRPHLRGSWRASFAWPALRHMLRIGLPIGIHQWLEIVAFGGALLLMGLFGTVALAAHNITITIVAMTYMVPLGTSSAAAVLVGHAIGRRDAEGARREASAALVCGVGFMAVSGLCLVLLPQVLSRGFTTDVSVIALAERLFPIAAAFQVFDGIQGVSSGILRGAGDTRVPMFLNLIGFVVVGIPASALLGFSAGLGPEGIWWGLVVCLGVVAALLAWRVHVRLGGDLERLETGGGE